MSPPFRKVGLDLSSTQENRRARLGPSCAGRRGSDRAILRASAGRAGSATVGVGPGATCWWGGSGPVSDRHCSPSACRARLALVAAGLESLVLRPGKVIFLLPQPEVAVWGKGLFPANADRRQFVLAFHTVKNVGEVYNFLRLAAASSDFAKRGAEGEHQSADQSRAELHMKERRWERRQKSRRSTCIALVGPFPKR